MEWEFGNSRCKLLYIQWKSNKVLLYSTGNCIQHPVINQNGKKKNLYVYLSPFAIQQKLTQHCTATILQYTLKKKKRKACINSTNNNISQEKNHLSVPLEAKKLRKKVGVEERESRSNKQNHSHVLLFCSLNFKRFILYWGIAS